MRGRHDTPVLLSANHIVCGMQDAFYLGAAKVDDGQSRYDTKVYEVACQVGPGRIISFRDDNTVDHTLDCYEADLKNQADKTQRKCVLLANKSNPTWMVAWLSSLAPNCTIGNIRFIGRVPEQPQKVYEVSCKDATTGGAGFYTLPESYEVPPAPIYPLAFASCLRAIDTDLKCKFTDGKGSINHFRPLATQASKGCIPVDARLMGGSKDALYYEILCTDQSDLVVVTDTFDRFKAAMDCTQGGQYGAKCLFGGKVPARAVPHSAQKQNLTDYTAALAKTGKMCTVADFNLLGTDTASNRQLVEFRCKETPYGLAGYMPAQGSEGKADLTDCFLAYLRKFECRFFPLATQKLRIADIASEDPIVKADCVVKDVRYVAALEDQGLTIEIACENKRGYMADMAATRDKFDRILPCRLAATRADWEKCTIPENGTFGQ